ncbi:unnamed protein product [Caenorhabditis angaria]|uniref:DM13 domain-containing protein n=1 Tax=Caenorhabditis angaria TaxID=860376 RepID=A0A9P1N9F1_9PELO|nr:unnamed protein product [Caenorhabditis angaria]
MILSFGSLKVKFREHGLGKFCIYFLTLQFLITEISENYKGGKDLILELPENYDIFHIDWISVFCVKYRVNFGNIVVPTDDTLANIPPYVPPFQRKPEIANMKPRGILRGTQDRRNLTFQLAETNNIKPYSGFPYLRAPKYVWFVNSVQTPDLYLVRNETYTFNIEGGKDKSIPQFFNPLYIGNDEHGAYNELSPMEAEKVTIYSPGPVDSNSGPLCIWSQLKPHQNASDMFLECDGWPEDVHTFVFTPNDTTPSVLYYNSATNFDMGGRIFIVDELPANLTDAQEIPYNREKWHTLALTKLRNGKVNTAKTTIAAFFMILVTIIVS